MSIKPLSEDDYHQVCAKNDTEAIIGRGFHEPRLKELFAFLKEAAHSDRRPTIMYGMVSWDDLEKLFGPLVKE